MTVFGWLQLGVDNDWSFGYNKNGSIISQSNLRHEILVNEWKQTFISTHIVTTTTIQISYVRDSFFTNVPHDEGCGVI